LETAIQRLNEGVDTHEQFGNSHSAVILKVVKSVNGMYFSNNLGSKCKVSQEG
jgi:hypothetical protein